MTITEEIQKQVAVGFSAKEIMANLRKEGYGYDEINLHLKLIKKAPLSAGPPPRQPYLFVTIISFLAAVSAGLSLAKRGYPTIGFLLMLAALVFFITAVFMRMAKK